MRLFKKLVISIVIFCIFGLLEAQAAGKFVRVAIIQDAGSIRLCVNGFYKVVDSLNNKTLNFGKSLNTVVVPLDEGIMLGDIIYKTQNILIEAADPESVIINDRKFRGNIQIIKKDSRHLLVVNLIELEDYIKGILYHEVSHYWPEDVLKAQAIVSRTYALSQMEVSSSRDYDVTCDIYSQVYGGKTSERYRTNKAVEQTKGQILTFNNKVFPTYFHATCAGHTEDASMLWKINIAPLKGVACGYCKDSPHYNWQANIKLKEIKAALIKNHYADSGDILSINILGKDASGRVTDLEIRTEKKDFKIPAKDFRIFVSPNLIRSTNFSVQVYGQDANFIGFGWGHGVGMCQWGAYSMSKTGHNYKSILEFYYPKSKISTYLKE